MSEDPGSRIILTLVEAEHDRGTDGAIFYDESLDIVAYRRVCELDDEEERDLISEYLSDDNSYGKAIVLVRKENGTRHLWLIPKRLIAEMAKTTSAVLLDQREIPVWETLKMAGSLASMT